MRKALTLFITLVLAGCMQLIGQGYYNPVSVNVASGGQVNVVYANQPTTINMTVNNPGNIHIPAGEQIDVMVSVNGDPAQSVSSITTTNGLLGLSTTGGFPNGVRSLQVNNPNIFFTPGRFGQGAAGGGGGALHDFTIWPTKPVGTGSSVQVVTYDSVHVQVLYINAAAFSTSAGSVVGLPSQVNFTQSYPVAISTQNAGIGVSSQPLEFYAQIDSYTAVLIGTIMAPVAVNASASLPVPAFNLQQLYSNNNITLPAGFKYASHSLRIFAREQGLQNNLNVASYTIPATATFPVTLTGFDGIAENNRIALAWTTAQEQNNARFIVEKQLVNGGFAAIGSVDGQGNSQSQQMYQFADMSPIAGANVYRLRQVDFDGTETVISNQLEVTFDLNQSNISITAYPNQFSDYLQVQVISQDSGYGSLELIDANGRVVYKEGVALDAGIQTRTIYPSKITQGMYIVRLSTANSQVITRAMKL